MLWENFDRIILRFFLRDFSFKIKNVKYCPSSSVLVVLLHSILQRCPADPQGVPQDPPGSSVSAVCGRRPPDPLHRCCCCCCSPPSAPSAAATAAAAPLVTRRWLEIRVIISSLAGDCSVVVYVLVRTSRPRQCCLLVMLWRCDSQYREVSNPRFCYVYGTTSTPA